MAKEDIFIIPVDAPKAGEVYRHYKGDLYEVVFLTVHSEPDELCVIYKPKYENPSFDFFSRLLQSWNEEVEWEGKKVKRFTKI